MIYGHCHSLLLIIIQRTSLATEFNEVPYMSKSSNTPEFQVQGLQFEGRL